MKVVAEIGGTWPPAKGSPQLPKVEELLLWTPRRE